MPDKSKTEPVFFFFVAKLSKFGSSPSIPTACICVMALADTSKDRSIETIIAQFVRASCVSLQMFDPNDKKKRKIQQKKKV